MCVSQAVAYPRHMAPEERTGSKSEEVLEAVGVTACRVTFGSWCSFT